MPPCAPQSTYQRNNSKHSSGTRRVIFPTLYEDTAASHSPELMEAVSVRLDTKVEVPSLASTTGSGFTLTNHYQPHPCPPPPPPSKMEIPEGATPPRLLCNRRSILGRYQPLPINPQFPAPTKPTQLVSILRATSFGGTGVTNTTTCPKKEGSSQSLKGHIRTGSPKAIRRSSSEPGRTKNHIQFDPRIWIREFERSPEEHDCTWYNDDDLERFKRHAMALIMACKDRFAPQIIPTGTGRTMTTRRTAKAAFYTHSALAMEMEDHSLTKAMHNEQYRAMVAQQEIQRILIVDPHDICITLFSKAFRTLFPHVHIVTASSLSDALEQIASQASSPSFDILVVEQRLQTHLQQQQHQQQSGSDLLKTLRQLQQQQEHMTLAHSSSLYIGVSAHPKDRTTLETSGADMCWGKPPPKMSVELRNQLLQALLLKRGKNEFSKELFG